MSATFHLPSPKLILYHVPWRPSLTSTLTPCIIYTSFSCTFNFLLCTDVLSNCWTPAVSVCPAGISNMFQTQTCNYSTSTHAPRNFIKSLRCPFHVLNIWIIVWFPEWLRRSLSSCACCACCPTSGPFWLFIVLCHTAQLLLLTYLSYFCSCIKVDFIMLESEKKYKNLIIRRKKMLRKWAKNVLRDLLCIIRLWLFVIVVFTHVPNSLQNMCYCFHVCYFKEQTLLFFSELL